MVLRIAIAGINGRMGQMICQAVQQQESVVLTVGTVRTQDEIEKNDHKNCALTTDLSKRGDDFDVLIDFTPPQVCCQNIEICKRFGKPIVVGTTGFNEHQKQSIQSIAQHIPLLLSPNMSYGVNLCFRLLSLVAQTVKDEDVDVEIIETHHRHKKDAPSGTALDMGRTIADNMNLDLEKNAIYCRHGVMEERPKKTIGFQSVRAGGVIGEHSTIFAFNGERIELNHKAENRTIYALGAVKAARWLVEQKPGLYDMQNVLFD